MDYWNVCAGFGKSCALEALHEGQYELCMCLTLMRFVAVTVYCVPVTECENLRDLKFKLMSNTHRKPKSKPQSVRLRFKCFSNYFKVICINLSINVMISRRKSWKNIWYSSTLFAWAQQKLKASSLLNAKQSIFLVNWLFSDFKSRKVQGTKVVVITAQYYSRLVGM